MLLGSSGTMIVTVNEQPVYHDDNVAGRGYSPDSDTVRLNLAKGSNRILVVSRQGIGAWCFSVQIAMMEPKPNVPSPALASVEHLRRFALEHRGDPQRGREIFFDSRGVGCARCHRAAGRGTATIGPDLTGLASKYDRAEVIRSVLEPSNRIATGYQPVVVATREGKVETGVVRAETDEVSSLPTRRRRSPGFPRGTSRCAVLATFPSCPRSRLRRCPPPSLPT